MNDTQQQDLAISLTRLVVAVPGVRGIYPQSVIAAALAGLVRSNHSAATGLLKISQTDTTTRINARLAVDSAAPTLDVIEAVSSMLYAALPDQLVDLDIEIAHID